MLRYSGISTNERRATSIFNQADERMLQLMYGMMKADLDQALETSLDKGLQESKEGKVRPHQEVMAEIRSRYKG